MKHFFVFILLSLAGSGAFAQNQFGLIPQVNITASAGNDWKINGKIEGRQLLIQHPFPDSKSEFTYKRTDLELVASKALNAALSIGGGYLIRREEGVFIHRFIQQLAITQKLSSSRLVHRIRTDETVEKGEALQLRLRYRLSWEKPLSGLKADPREFYLKINNEYIGILQDQQGDFELRGLASLGYNLSDANKIEAGMDYRLEEIITTPTHKLFLSLSFYHSF